MHCHKAVKALVTDWFPKFKTDCIESRSFVALPETFAVVTKRLASQKWSGKSTPSRSCNRFQIMEPYVSIIESKQTLFFKFRYNYL